MGRCSSGSPISGPWWLLRLTFKQGYVWIVCDHSGAQAVPSAWWDHPDHFDPDHFTPEHSAGRPKYAFIPFGAGIRQCIGNQFAMMEMQLATILLVRRFRPRLVPGQRIEPASATTLKLRFGLKMTFEAP